MFSATPDSHGILFTRSTSKNFNIIFDGGLDFLGTKIDFSPIIFFTVVQIILPQKQKSKISLRNLNLRSCFFSFTLSRLIWKVWCYLSITESMATSPSAVGPGHGHSQSQFLPGYLLGDHAPHGMVYKTCLLALKQYTQCQCQVQYDVHILWNFWNKIVWEMRNNVSRTRTFTDSWCIFIACLHWNDLILW